MTSSILQNHRSPLPDEIGGDKSTPIVHVTCAPTYHGQVVLTVEFPPFRGPTGIAAIKEVGEGG